MEEKQIEKKQKKMITKKRAYTPPVLTVYGKLIELTAGGTSGNPETGSGTNPNKKS